MAQIIASMFAESPGQVLRQARRAAMEGADWLELRLDLWPTSLDLAPLIEAIHLPVLAACRMPEDGGQFRGTVAERRSLLSMAIAAGAAGLDLEIDDPWAPPLGGTRLRLLVRSYHSFTGVPKELHSLRDRMHRAAGAVAKIVVSAHDLADAAPVLDLLGSTDQNVQPTVAFAMGRTAWPTRVLAAMLGAPFVYGSIEAGQETAPGQLPVALLRGLYRVRELGSKTQLFGLLGNPALQSLGPWLHNRVFRRLGLDAVYLPFETFRPEAVLAMLPAERLRGLSVTAPWKETMVQACNHLTPTAEATGVVNTILVAAHGMRQGYNTDVAGVREALAAAGLGAGAGRRGVVLGAGGAARAGAVALAEMGFAVTMLGRSLEPAREFAKAAGVQLGSMTAGVLEELAPAVILQATPLGSVGREPDERPVPDYRFVPGTMVLDMVYQPRWTRFLRDAAAQGAVVVPGAEMFLHQAAAQVELFTSACGGKAVAVATETLRSLLAGTAVGDAAQVS
ncbi:MAG: type I 3-dehydroquinate dehydratase [Planctomycetes bacterium]|nr:type I 3-dehydroquinate dehydratase [Planctomycetota bacterium]